MTLTAQQLEVRRGGIGSSEIAALIFDPETGRSIHPYLSPLRLFQEKRGLAPARESTPEQEWGSDVEHAILAAEARRVRRALWTPGTLVDLGNPLARATPDALLLPNEQVASFDVLEAKNVGFWNKGKWQPGESDADAPLHYVTQTNWEMGVARGARLTFTPEGGVEQIVRIGDTGHLVASIEGAPPRHFAIPWDEELYQALLYKAAKFWRDHVETGREPAGWEEDGAALDYCKARWAKNLGHMLSPTAEAQVVHGELVRAKVALKAAKALAKKWSAKMCALIGDADGIAGLATWKKNKDTRAVTCDWEAVLKDWALHISANAPDLVEPLRALQQVHIQERVTKVGPRVLLVKGMPKTKNHEDTSEGEDD